MSENNNGIVAFKSEQCRQKKKLVVSPQELYEKKKMVSSTGVLSQNVIEKKIIIIKN